MTAIFLGVLLVIVYVLTKHFLLALRNMYREAKQEIIAWRSESKERGVQHEK